MHVADDQRERLAARAGLTELRECLADPGDGRREHPPIAQHLFEDEAVGGIVVDDQNPRAVDDRRLDGSHRRRLFLSQSEPGREVKRAPLADLAFRPDPPAHQFHESGRNGQTQAGAAEPTRGGGVGLLEGAEDDAEFVLGDSDSRVADREVEDDLAV